MTRPSATTLRDWLASPALLGLLVIFALLSLSTLELLKLQPAGVDFAGIWAGGKAALTDISRLYDFRYVSELQNWPLGVGRLRPYAYPPSALFFFMPFALGSWNLTYAIFTGATAAFFAWAGIRAGAPKWFVLIPWVAFAAFCGQVTFLLGGLVMTALVLNDDRPILAGVLFGMAAAIKPQLLMLLPLALIAEARWRTVVATGVTGLALCAASVAVWGLDPWFEWLSALPRFEALVLHARLLVANAITPYSALVYWHEQGTWALLLAPISAVWVWLTFRRPSEMADRIIALFGGAFLISPYAMNYELALFAPATASYLARTRDRRWPLYVVASIAQVWVIHPAFFNFAATLALPLVKRVPAHLIGEGRGAEPSLIPNR